MSDIQLYLFHFDKDKGEASKHARETASRLQRRELRLVTLIESLREYLNSEDPSTRTKTLSYLAEILESTRPKTLTSQQRGLLFEFLSTRIADESDALPSCARALLALDNLGSWEAQKTPSLIHNILQHTSPLSRYRFQSERYPVLQLIDRLLAKHRKDLQELHNASPDFTSRLVAYFDGEKDPRNLMVIFSILLVPMTEWHLRSHAADLFEAVFNYFPITFRPPPDDPYGITAQDLKDRLRCCIAASADLAPHCIPALLDKLDSNSINTKRDVLQALNSCVENYGPHTISQYSVALWDSLKFEILQAQDEDLAREALNVLAGMAKHLSRGSSSALMAYLKPVVKEANAHLEDAPTKQSQATERILESLSSASPASWAFISNSVFPHLFALYGSADTNAKKRGLVELLNALIRANLTVFGEWRAFPTLAEQDMPEKSIPLGSNPLADSSSQILDVLSKAIASTPIQEVSYRLATLDALTSLGKARSVLSDANVSRIIGRLDDIILNEEPYGNDIVKTASMTSLVAIAQQKPQLVIDVAFPQFLAKLPETDSNNITVYVPVLEAFAQMAKEPKVFGTVILRLNSRLASAVSGRGRENPSVNFIRALLLAMLFAFGQNASTLEGTTTTCPYFEDFIRRYIQAVGDATSTTGHPLQDPTCVELIAKISNIIFRVQTVDFQQSVADEIPYGLWRENAEHASLPLGQNPSPAEMHFLVIQAYMLASLRRDFKLNLDNQALLHRLSDLAQRPDVAVHVKQAATQQIALLLNKFVPAKSLAGTVDGMLGGEDGILSKAQINNDRIRIAFSVAKALLLRNASNVPTVIAQLFQSLSSSQAGLTVARGYATLLQPDELLNRDNHCIVSPLYRQRLFNLIISNITQSFHEADATLKRNYLVALSGVIRWLPYAIIEPELTALTPLLLQMLDLADENEVKAPAIDTMVTVLTQQPRSLEEHASSLISRLLGATSAKSNPPIVRARALHCLTLVPAQMKREIVIPFRRQVVKRLLEALDDRKRAVRMEAVACRKTWIELDDGADSDE